MSDGQIIALIGCISWLILLGAAIRRRRINPRSMIALVGLWGAIILLGVLLARLWLAHHSWPQ